MFESCHRCDETLILVFNTFYVELFILFYKKWMESSIPISKLNSVVLGVEKYVKGNATKIISGGLERYYTISEGGETLKSVNEHRRTNSRLANMEREVGSFLEFEPGYES